MILPLSIGVTAEPIGCGKKYDLCNLSVTTKHKVNIICNVCRTIWLILTMTTLKSIIAFSTRDVCIRNTDLRCSKQSSSGKIPIAFLIQDNIRHNKLEQGKQPFRFHTHSSSASQSTLLASSTETEKRGRGRRSKSEEAEWKALIAAFQMYKAAYGDLKVPSRFVVPAMPPWPESGWGLKLGQRVAAIRSMGKYIEDDDERRKVLDDMGFLWRLRAPSPDKNVNVSFDQIYDALVTYRKEIQPKGSLSVPTNFIVPNYDPWPEATRDLPLGKKISTIRSKAFLKANPDARDKLKEIGFQFDGKVAANDARFNNVYEALVRYKELNGDLLVPQPFVIPDKNSDWPEQMWGLRLGARVNAIRSQGTFVKTNPSRREQLDKLGFEWELPSSAGKKRGRKKKSEIEALSGPAPPGLLESGLPNGEKTSKNSSISSTAFNPSAAFDEDFFNIGNEKPDTPRWGFEDEEIEQQASLQQQAAEETYQPPKNLTESLNAAKEMAISVGVVDPSGTGKRVTKGKIHKAIPWFNDDFGDDFVFGDVVEALQLYKDIHGNFDGLDDKDFVVPEPVFTADIDFQASARAAAEIAKAEATGGDSDSLIAAEIERMEMELSESTDNQNIEEGNWPEHLAGLRLGSITSRIRDGSLEVKHLTERKSQLDAIGFTWGDERHFLDVPFEKAMCAMFAYFLIRGDLFVYEDFVMPDDEPWPSVFAGYELGKAVKRIRELQNFFEAYHPEKVRLLRRVEFVWFPELALPLNPEDGDDTWEDIVVQGVGHPFFQLNEPSVSMLENLQANGPFSAEGKTKSWYDYNEVADFWEKGDIVDSGKPSERPGWTPAEWLWFNGYEQLSRDHEDRYGVNNGLEMVRLIELLHDGKISEKEFDERAGSVMQNHEVDQLRKDAMALGVDIDIKDDLETIIRKVKEDPEFQFLDEDPEYLMIQKEMDEDDARKAVMLQVEEEDVEEEEMDEIQDDDFDEYEYYEEEDDEISSENKDLKDDEEFAIDT